MPDLRGSQKLHYLSRMILEVASLNSGSNGNCYYIGNEHEAILVDMGLSRRETEKRLKRLGVSLEKIKAVFISHEHGDHVFGVNGFCKRHKRPVYGTSRTLESANLGIEEHLIRTMTTYEAVHIGALAITAFPKKHDACDPHSFLVTGNGIRIGIFTDIGHCCTDVVRNFQQCHAAFLETNYDEDMLEQGSYPYSLKARIRGGSGHLSNREALKLFREHKPAFMSHLFLSHLSRENNSPRVAAELFHRHAGKTEIIVASRDEETALYQITNNTFDLAHSPYSRAVVKKSQLSLF